MSQITTHVLDTAIGAPARGLRIILCQRHDGGNEWIEIARGETDDDGRIVDWGIDLSGDLPAGCYKLIFASGDYHAAQNVPHFYPQIEIHFNVADRQHYHVPLLLSPFGYSTYRGS